MGTETRDDALLELLDRLQRRGYRFVTPLNATYRLLRRRSPGRRAADLRDMLGWSLPFRPGSIDPEVEGLLEQAGCLRRTVLGLRATVRVSEVQGRLFLHSAYPTRAKDAVFLGPDTYRFAEFLRVELAAWAPPAARIVDVGAGAGVGGVLAAGLLGAAEVTLSDVNPQALRLAAINAAHAGVPVQLHRAEGLDRLPGPYDLVMANPPFIAGGGKTYSDGGLSGTDISLAWADAAMSRLRPGGRLMMYTGSPIVAGEDAFRAALQAAAEAHGCSLAYRELDPDIFGRELSRPAYADVERIAAVGAVAARS